MKFSKKFEAALERYLQWAKCSTPFTGVEAFERKLHSAALFPPGETSAEEIIFERESHGTCSATGCSDPELLQRYERGKANRDWWTKEKGWWMRNASSIPEEFLPQLTDECFYELFGRWPIAEIVRMLFDNHYSYAAFRVEMWVKQMEWNNRFSLRGFDRDYRLPWWKTGLLALWNLDETVRVKRRVDVWVWRLTHRRAA